MSSKGKGNEMQQNTTDIELSPKQHQAIEQLLQGQSITAVARQINVDRSTIYRWQDDVYFEAECNKKARELRDASKARLVQLAEKSLAVIGDALDAGDAKTALAVLKGIGYLPGTIAPIGSTDPEQLENEQVIAQRQKDHQDRMNALTFSL